MVSLWGRPWTRGELLARVGRLDQVAGVQLVEASDGAERGVRLLRFGTGSGFEFDVLVDRGFDIGRAWLSGRPLAWWSPPWYRRDSARRPLWPFCRRPNLPFARKRVHAHSTARRSHWTKS